MSVNSEQRMLHAFYVKQVACFSSIRIAWKLKLLH